jgi:hypothetical protein
MTYEDFDETDDDFDEDDCSFEQPEEGSLEAFEESPSIEEDDDDVVATFDEDEKGAQVSVWETDCTAETFGKQSRSICESLPNGVVMLVAKCACCSRICIELRGASAKVTEAAQTIHNCLEQDG